MFVLSVIQDDYSLFLCSLHMQSFWMPNARRQPRLKAGAQRTL
jgi:hypothetical protein